MENVALAKTSARKKKRGTQKKKRERERAAPKFWTHLRKIADKFLTFISLAAVSAPITKALPGKSSAFL